MDNYLKEIEALQRWIKATAGLNSYRLKEAKPKLPRPVILWETPSRKKARNLSSAVRVEEVTQYGRLFVESYEKAVEVQEKLITSIEEDNNSTLPVYDGISIIGYLKSVKIEFRESDALDVPFNVKYEVAYSKAQPAPAPNATAVYNKITAK